MICTTVTVFSPVRPEYTIHQVPHLLPAVAAEEGEAAAVVEAVAAATASNPKAFTLTKIQPFRDLKFFFSLNGCFIFYESTVPSASVIVYPL